MSRGLEKEHRQREWKKTGHRHTRQHWLTQNSTSTVIITMRLYLGKMTTLCKFRYLLHVPQGRALIVLRNGEVGIVIAHVHRSRVTHIHAGMSAREIILAGNKAFLQKVRFADIHTLNCISLPTSCERDK